MPPNDDISQGSVPGGGGSLHFPKRRPPNPRTKSTQSAASENTPLLSRLIQSRQRTDSPHGSQAVSEIETVSDSESDIDPNDFDLMLSRSASYTSGLGIEPQTQDFAMLRGPRRYSLSVSRRPSVATLRRRRSALSGMTGDEADITEEAEEEAEQDLESDVENIETGRLKEGESPFLNGVGVGQFWCIFGVILLNMFVACFDGTIMASSHPVITSYFRSSNSASWLSTAFLLTSTSFQPLFGRLSDTMGRKPPLLFTLVVFELSTVWCALAQSMTSFIIARAFCGLGAGGMLSLGSIITSDLVPIEIRGAYQSYINIVYGFGSALGAATGGAIADHLGWRWEFGIQVPLLLFSIIAAAITVPNNIGLKADAKNESLVQAMRGFDYTGSILLTSAITFLILGLNLGGNIYPWTHPLVLTSLTISLLTTPLFIYVESRPSLHKPIMPLSLLLQPPRNLIILSNFLAATATNAILFNVPIFFQAVLLESATSSGVRLVLPSLASSACGVATGFIITYSRRMKWSLVLGASCIVLGGLCLSSMHPCLPDWLLSLYLIPGSSGQGFLFPGSFMAVLASSSQSEQAVVTSTLVLWRSLGMVLGIAGSSLVLQNALLAYLEEYVAGPEGEKQRVVELVRDSIQAIGGLEAETRAQVVRAYADALRVTFLGIVGSAGVAVLLVVWVRVPRLGRRGL